MQMFLGCAGLDNEKTYIPSLSFQKSKSFSADLVFKERLGKCEDRMCE